MRDLVRRPLQEKRQDDRPGTNTPSARQRGGGAWPPSSPLSSRPQCNNPMTKEPKLQAAVRIVAEWSDYDQEIKRLQGRVQENTGGASKDQSSSTA